MPVHLSVPWPEGFSYLAEFVSEDEERRLAEGIARLSFGEVRMHGIVARRRVAHFGWLYGFETFRATPGPPLPEFLAPVRERAASLLQIPAADLAEALVTEYPEGATIGWHRDAPPFGRVFAVSLLSACRLRFRRSDGEIRATSEAAIAPRSAYVLQGAARAQWQHSIPAVKSFRYSITFRTLRRDRDAV